MRPLDWYVLSATLLGIILYGIYRSRKNANIESYFLAGRSMPWYQIGLSVMATQASAITFISGPGQSFSDGMRFIQFYLGLPLAVIVLCTSFIPVFHKLNVFTAYEYLEKRFDIRTRLLAATLFLLLRAVSTAVSIYAPSIILSTILNLPTQITTVLIGLLVISYTVSGGSKAVAHTQFIQMFIIFAGLGLAGYQIFELLPAGTGFSDAMHISGALGRLNALDFHADLHNKYTVWSGLIGGFFLQLSYFGTDQSQVSRYLTGSSVAESRLGLLLNGFLKIPMQFLILLLGTLVFVFFQFTKPPAFFNEAELNTLQHSPQAGDFRQLEKERDSLFDLKKQRLHRYVSALKAEDKESTRKSAQELLAAQQTYDQNGKDLRALIKKGQPSADTNDSNYVFLSFVIRYLPHGTVGMIIAIVFLASMSSVASACNSMASCSVVDFYQRWFVKEGSEKHYVGISRLFTIFWGLVCIVFALYVGKLGSNLLEAVNSLGSLFYGTILGIFLVAFYMKQIGASAIFYAALLAEAGVLLISYLNLMEYLWLNVLGVLLVFIFSFLIQTCGRSLKS